MSELANEKGFQAGLFWGFDDGCSGNHRSFFLLLCCHHRYRFPESRLFACCFLIVALRWLVFVCLFVFLLFPFAVALLQLFGSFLASAAPSRVPDCFNSAASSS